MLLAASCYAILSGIAPVGEGDPLRVTWEAPAGCPSEDDVRARVDALLGGSQTAASGAGMVVDARARVMSDGTWSVSLQLASEDGARIRTIPGGRDCAEAAEAAAVVIAIAIDPEAAARIAAQPTAEDSAEDGLSGPAVPEPAPEATEAEAPTEVLPEPESEPEPAPSPEAAAPEEAAPKARRIGPVRGVAGVVGGLAYGELPGVAGVLGLDGGIALPRARVTASASYWPRRRVEVGSADIDFRQWSVALRGCPVFRVRPVLEVLACGGLEIGQTIVRTRGVVGGATDPDALWIAWLAQPALVVLPLSWLGVRIGAELFGPVLRATYSVAPVGDVWTPPPVGIRGLVAVEARFP